MLWKETINEPLSSTVEVASFCNKANENKITCKKKLGIVKKQNIKREEKKMIQQIHIHFI